MHHAHVLASGDEAEPDTPAQPVSAALGALGDPPGVGIEQMNVGEELVAGDIDSRRRKRDPVRQRVDFVSGQARDSCRAHPMRLARYGQMGPAFSCLPMENSAMFTVGDSRAWPAGRVHAWR
jgi:hypothetical protein